MTLVLLKKTKEGEVEEGEKVAGEGAEGDSRVLLKSAVGKVVMAALVLCGRQALVKIVLTQCGKN